MTAHTRQLPHVGVVTGLAREAACLHVFAEDVRPQVLCAGSSASRAAEIARRLVADGCVGIVSFGVAGGLSPDAPPGTLIVPDAVVAANGERMATDEPWCRRLTAALGNDPRPLVAGLVGTVEPAVTPRQKRSLWQTSRACAVDTESFAVVHAANKAGVPAIVVRAVADPWDQAIPPWLTGVIDSEGRPVPTRLALGLIKRPWQVAELAALATTFSRALRTLRRVALRVGPLFQFDR